MTRWRKKIAAADADELLRETLAAGLQTKMMRPRDLQRVVVDTTVQKKALAYPTDAALHDDIRRELVRMSQTHGREAAPKLCAPRQVRVGRRGAQRAGIKRRV